MQVIEGKIKLLVLAKTYPTFSQKYNELVCTAGVLESGKWIRIYPIPFRSLYGEQQYKKYNWIELDVIKNTKDSRYETYRPSNLDDIKVVGEIPTDKYAWAARRNIVLKKTTIYNCFEEVLKKTTNNEMSLGIFHPKRINKVIVRELSLEEIEKYTKQQEKKKRVLAQKELFHDKEIKPMPIIPYRFSYEFLDINDKKRRLQILDWEIFQLYNNTVKNKSPFEASQVVQKRYEELANTKDLYFFIGTRLVAERKNQPNPYSIIGVFYPPFEISRSLFDDI